ncbi:hypothetical protein M3221_13705 [Domibacillus indicus]|uniref:hypothetical protein n=1 Tax=Domibacillus indicus TaxID=1437523 RepID=UPI0020424DCA|nr:hypothetical protein [Domibacillus indicus]MCM3789456.1 hypothetical protein [Domibacillus indicus]
MKELTLDLSKELGKLIDEYYQSSDPEIKQQIQSKVQLLNEAILLCDQATSESDYNQAVCTLKELAVY